VRRLLLPLALLASSVPAQEPPAAPAQLIITYRCPPPRRAAFRQYMTEQGLSRFERWKQEGVLKDYRFLFNWFIDVDTWDAMALLSFPDSAAFLRWKDIEKTSPGGLPRDGLDMAWPLNSYLADVVSHDSAEAIQGGAPPIYFVVPYDSPTAAAFREYVRSFGGPQAKALMGDGLIVESSFFVNRYAGGKRWQGMSVFVFKDFASLARREEVMSKARTAGSPAMTREPILAEPVEPASRLRQ